ncbi:MAG: hypothetical protein ABR949_10330 [Candidatus Aquilonibacter sp.]|jgi:co-chaperonin GroES (HSP10)
MALDPRALTSRGLYKLKIHDVKPEDIEPNGDRYVVEEIDVDEYIERGQLLVITQNAPKHQGDPMADPTIENRGVIVAVVIRAGNGHLLGLPDPYFIEDGKGVQGNADVPMFFSEGDVVFVDHNAKGRALRILGREVRIINQIDVLAKMDGVKLKRGEHGWEQVEE